MGCRARRWVAALLLSSACTGGFNRVDDGSGQGVPAPSPAELRPLDDALSAALSANATRQCVRPVLRGEAVAGSADAAMRVVLEPDLELQGCFDAVRREAPDRAAHCTTLPKRVQAAVAHEDACSPYLLGRGPPPRSLLPYMLATRGLAAIGERWIEDDRRMDALRLWLDGVRLGQDLARGGSTWIEALIAQTGTQHLIEPLHAALDAEELSTAELASLAEEIDRLIAAEPHPRTHLLADRFHGLIYFIVPSLKDDWEPPGGWPRDIPAPEPGSPDDQRMLLVAWRATEELAQAQAKACPAESTVTECLRGLDELTERLVEDGKHDLSDIAEVIADPASGSEALIAAKVKAMAAPGFAKYIKRASQRRVALHALRLHVTVRSASRCPSPEALDLEVAGLGAAFEAELEDGMLVLTPPAEVEVGEPTKWGIRCPSGA